MVNMDDVPVLAIATGHNEMLSNSNMASFVDMMESQNFQVVTFDMLTEEIPEDTQVLMIATPPRTTLRRRWTSCAPSSMTKPGKSRFP